MKLLPVEELGLVGLRTVKTNMLGTNEIFARRGVLGDLEFQLRHAPGTPSIRSKTTTLIAESLFPDLEPFSITFVLFDVTGGCLGHD